MEKLWKFQKTIKNWIPQLWGQRCAFLMALGPFRDHSAAPRRPLGLPRRPLAALGRPFSVQNWPKGLTSIFRRGRLGPPGPPFATKTASGGFLVDFGLIFDDILTFFGVFGRARTFIFDNLSKRNTTFSKIIVFSAGTARGWILAPFWSLVASLVVDVWYHWLPKICVFA